MNKEELITKWEKEYEHLVNLYEFAEDEGDLCLANAYLDQKVHIRSFIEDLKQLNGVPVKRDYILPDVDDVKRWFQLLVGKGKDVMLADIKAKFSETN